jgi:hypothetical protein
MIQYLYIFAVSAIFVALGWNLVILYQARNVKCSLVLRDRLHSYIIFTLSLFINAERRMVIQI